MQKQPHTTVHSTYWDLNDIKTQMKNNIKKLS